MDQLLYFSLNKETWLAFHKYVELNRFEYRYSFRMISSNNFQFFHVSDLAYCLKQQKNPSHVKVIVDYVSLTSPYEFESNKNNAQESIRRLILQYPEVFFLFDETACNDNEYKFDFTDFLFPSCKELVENFLFKEYHRFDAKENNPFIVFDRARNNLFDGSNLRYVAKRFLYGDLKVGKHNFGVIQSSRARNLALCVEEEDVQNRFNCYSLYSNGFRALPVLSSRELLYFNEKHDILKPKIITRDYDLQFDDIEHLSNYNEVDWARGYKYFEKQYNEVDWVRGYKYFEEQHKWIILDNENENQWEMRNPYWSNLNKYPVVFVTKGPDSMSVQFDNQEEPLIVKLDKTVDTLCVRGTHKPVPGIYTSFQKLQKIHDVASNIFACFNRNWLFQREIAYCVFYEKFQQLDNEIKEKKEKGTFSQQEIDSYSEKQNRIIKLYENVVKLHESDSPLKCSVIKNDMPGSYFWLHQLYSLKTGRADHDHGVPLNVYDMVKEMVDRAKLYYEEKKYTRAAIISWEAIEVMNGFHEALTLKAYHIYALCDNAIAMNVLGGKDEELTEDTRFRVRRIRSDVNRILYRHQNNDERQKFAKNALNQIFNDCRAFCKEKEHYGSESVFISAIGHLNDSDPTWLKLLKLRRIIVTWLFRKKYMNQLRGLDNNK